MKCKVAKLLKLGSDSLIRLSLSAVTTPLEVINNVHLPGSRYQLVIVVLNLNASRVNLDYVEYKLLGNVRC